MANGGLSNVGEPMDIHPGAQLTLKRVSGQRQLRKMTRMMEAQATEGLWR